MHLLEVCRITIELSLNGSETKSSSYKMCLTAGETLSPGPFLTPRLFTCSFTNLKFVPILRINQCCVPGVCTDMHHKRHLNDGIAELCINARVC